MTTPPLPILSLVSPCYNEQEVLPLTVPRLLTLLEAMVKDGQVSPESHIVFIDDGSRDNTWNLLEEFARQDKRVKAIKLSRNRGHQNALLAGLMTAQGDILISLDADLQDDLGAIPRMVTAYAEGADIALGVRLSRSVDTPFKRITARLYYRVLRHFGVEIVPDHADFRLLSRRAIDALRDFTEVNLFLRGIIPLLGFKTAIIKYDRLPRLAGETKYPFRKMLALAITGITSFSAVPLTWITWLGFTISLVSFIFGAYTFIAGFIDPSVVPGWASTVVPIYFLGGLQLFSLGIIGSYIAKVYLETKRRPRFIIDKSI